MRGFRDTVSRAGTVLVLALGVVLGTSCSSSTTGTSLNGDLYLRLKVNGTPVEFTVQASLRAAFSGGGTQYNALITGYGPVAGVGLQIFDGQPIAVGQYSGYTIVGTSQTGDLIDYTDESGTSYAPDTQKPVDCTITITDINSTRVHGTFQGTVSAAGHADIVITEGEFLVERAN